MANGVVSALICAICRLHSVRLQPTPHIELKGGSRVKLKSESLSVYYILSKVTMGKTTKGPSIW